MSKLNLLNKASLTENNLREIITERQKLVNELQIWKAKNPGNEPGIGNDGPLGFFGLSDLNDAVDFMVKYIIKLEQEIEKLKNA